jgi:hypothetical protein
MKYNLINLRACFLNPLTTEDHVSALVDLAAAAGSAITAKMQANDLTASIPGATRRSRRSDLHAGPALAALAME